MKALKKQTLLMNLKSNLLKTNLSTDLEKYNLINVILKIIKYFAIIIFNL